MQRRARRGTAWLTAAAAIGLACSERRADEAPPRPPNLVVILADDLRADALEAPFQSFAQTPALDRLAAEGARFDRSFVVTPLCEPSRATLLTGLYTHRTRVSANRVAKDREPPPELALRLQRAGYQTAFLGKYHVGNHCRPRDGFDRFACTIGRHGQSAYYGTRLHQVSGVRELDGHVTQELAAVAAEWIGEMRTRPFFLLLSLKSPHAPTTPSEGHANAFADARIPLPESARDPISLLPPAMRVRAKNGAILGVFRRMAARGDPLVEMRREYARALLDLDDAVARVDAALTKAELRDDTLLLFTSDNGLLLGEHGLWRKEVAYEESIRVPLLLRYPRGVAEAQTRDELALNIDLAPTLLARAAAPHEDLDGRDLFDLIGVHATPETASWRSEFVVIGPYREAERPPLLALRGTRFKYVRHLVERIDEELFDLVSDPSERRNLARDPAHSRRLAAQRAALTAATQALGIPAAWLEAGAQGRSRQKRHSK
jgi:N-acetylglucosamine-6-sulfatase